MIIKISGTIAVFIASFTLLLSADQIAECFNDGLSEEISSLKIAGWVDCLSPIYTTTVIFSIGLAIAYWLLSKAEKRKYSNMIWHFISILFSLIALTSISSLASLEMYLDGPREVTKGRIIGNISIGLCIFVFIVFGILYRIKPKKKTQ